ncbi:MAG: Single-stranded nucleic acid binding R3H domain protein [candidate division WS6 bacterium 36_33]|uniref:Single-stranded nucleic acid binding R3H domain protein n=1 Tax=candidate division WS6 bacterium 36_33 TaxID=1641388 RepID=A0A101GZG4_9BACT|nr:MAG: Single-stranded nucleic acid binding R3H domain protein [candidate division WS6 bacterium 36_33]
MKDKELIKLVEKEVETLCSLLEVDCERGLNIEEGEDEVKYIKISFEGEDLGYMIGNRGRHLDSIQYILQLMVGKMTEQDPNYRILVDVGGYRKERNSHLEEMALQKADDVRILGEAVELPPMEPADRRAIHIALSEYDDIITESDGEGRDRHIVIKPANN